jgi:predicted NBD/HSP70 family sugar kinase
MEERVMSSESAPLAPVGHARQHDVARTTDNRQTSNDSAVLQAVLDHGPVSRTRIARHVGLSPAAVTRLSAELITAGLLRESAQPVGPAPKAAGRPHVPLEVDTVSVVACGLHITIKYSALALLDLRGQVIALERLSHRGSDPAGVIDRAVRRFPGFVARHADGRSPLGLGVSIGGWVDRDDGVVVEHARLGWREVPVRRLLADATGLPVRVDNQARALARHEQLFGDPRARASIVQLFVANMIDGAFSVGGTIHHGPQSAAGAVAHLPLDGRTEQCVCGLRGCLQAAVASDELGARAARAGITAEPSFQALEAAAERGDPRALDLFHERARLVGTAAALLLDVLNPELLVVFEAGVMRLPGCLDALRAQARRRTRRREDPSGSIIASSFGRGAADVAAAAVILDAVYGNPLRAALWGQAG